MVQIEFRTDNDIFVQCGLYEVARILRNLRERCEDTGDGSGFAETIRDANGNVIGSAVILLDVPE